MIGVVCLLALLVTAHRHQGPRTEALAALGAVLVVLVTGYLRPHDAVDAVRPLAPVVGFLLAILVVAEVRARAGLFEAAATAVRRHSRHDPRRLFVGVFALAAMVTMALSLDATVVLLTPVVIGAARELGASGRPGAGARAHPRTGQTVATLASALLANLLWRRTLARDGITPSNGRFQAVSLALTPIALLAAVAALSVTS